MTRIKRLKKNKQGVIGLTGVLLTMMSGLVGPLLVEKPAGFTTDILMPPSAVHLFGTDNLGLDILGELVWGAQTSIYISVTAVLLATAIGVIAGLICGYEEGLGAEAIDFFVDIVMTLPVLPLSIIAAALFGTTSGKLAVIMGLFGWPPIFRLTRNLTRQQKNLPYIEAVKCLKIPKWRILICHIVPNEAGSILVNVTLMMAQMVLTEAGLSFLGLGSATDWSWGMILRRAWEQHAVISVPNPWWWWLMPCLCVAGYVICFHMLGVAISDSINEK